MSISGVFAAVVTPFDESGRPDETQLHTLLGSMAAAGCTGVLLTGTTGEGPSLSAAERAQVYRFAAPFADRLTLLAGTGASSLADTIAMTREAYDAGLHAAVILPPFFFDHMPELELFRYYQAVVTAAVPGDAPVMLYHNPQVTAVHIRAGLAARLCDAFPQQVVGIKNSAAEWDDPAAFLEAPTLPDFAVLVGRDELLTPALRAGGAGAITGAANLFARDLRAVWDAFHTGDSDAFDTAQATLNHHKSLLSGPPRIAALKYLLKVRGILTNDEVRLPLRPLTAEERSLLDERVPL